MPQEKVITFNPRSASCSKQCLKNGPGIGVCASKGPGASPLCILVGEQQHVFANRECHQKRIGF